LKRYVCTEESTQVFSGALNPVLEKTIDVISSGPLDERKILGFKMWVDPNGVIVKGPDPLIGYKFDDVKDLDFETVFTTSKSVMRAIGETNKSITNVASPTVIIKAMINNQLRAKGRL